MILYFIAFILHYIIMFFGNVLYYNKCVCLYNHFTQTPYKHFTLMLFKHHTSFSAVILFNSFIFFPCLHRSICLLFTQVQQHFYEHDKQSTHSIDLAFPPLSFFKNLARFKIHLGCNLHAKVHQFFMALTLWALTARRE